MILHEIRKTPSYSGAICKKGILCEYSRDFDRSDDYAKVDVCSKCGKKQIYRVKDGRINDAKYRKDHLRDLIQRGSGLYEMIYGESRAMHAIKSKEKASAELRENTAEMVRRAMMLENQGKL